MPFAEYIPSFVTAGVSSNPFGYMSPNIQANLPWAGTPSAPPTSAAGVAANYQGEYQKSLAMNQSMYNNILTGYQQLIQQQSAGYKSLYDEVIGSLKGAETSRLQDVADQSKAQLAHETQSLINRGLGNTTVQGAIAAGVEADKQRRLTEVSNQFAQTRAGYMSQLGGSQLANLAGLSRSQLDFMNSMQAQYPDAGMYGALAARFGEAAGMRDGDKPWGFGASGGGMGAMPGLPGPKVGYTPAPTYQYGSGGYGSAMGGGYSGMSSGPSWLMEQYAQPGSAGAYANYADFGTPSGAIASAAGAGYGMADLFGGGGYSGGGDFG